MADGRWQMADGRWQMADGNHEAIRNAVYHLEYSSWEPYQGDRFRDASRLGRSPVMPQARRSIGSGPPARKSTQVMPWRNGGSFGVLGQLARITGITGRLL